MQLLVSCPECSTGATISLSEDEVESIKKKIVEAGRSPTLLAKCKNGHELLVTLYFRDDTLGIRDVAVPLGAVESEESMNRKKTSEFDWLRDAFGGDD